MDIGKQMQSLVRVLQRGASELGPAFKWTSELSNCFRGFNETLRTYGDLTTTEVQLCCAVVAFCLQLKAGVVNANEDEEYASEIDDFDHTVPLNDIAKTFLYQKLDTFSESEEKKMVLTWSALFLGSFLLQQPDNRLRTKGYIMHVNLSLHLNLGLGLTCESPALHDDDHSGWTMIESLLSGSDRMDTLWHSELIPQWRLDWQESMKRQRRWEKRGVWMIGAPKRLAPRRRSSSKSEKVREGMVAPFVSATMLDRYGDVDIIEYLVLREARDSLPRVE